MESPRIAQLKADIAALSLEVKPLAEKSQTAELTQDESKRFDELVAQINGAGEKLAEAINQDAKSIEMLRVHQQYNASSNVNRGDPLANGATEPDGDAPQRVKSIGR